MGVGGRLAALALRLVSQENSLGRDRESKRRSLPLLARRAWGSSWVRPRLARLSSGEREQPAGAPWRCSTRTTHPDLWARRYVHPQCQETGLFLAFLPLLPLLAPPGRPWIFGMPVIAVKRISNASLVALKSAHHTSSSGCPPARAFSLPFSLAALPSPPFPVSANRRLSLFALPLAVAATITTTTAPLAPCRPSPGALASPSTTNPSRERLG